MSDTSAIRQYEISGMLGNDGFNVMLTDPAMTDQAAIAIAQMFRTVQLPPGMTRNVSIFKADQNTVIATANLDDDQPVFA